MASAGYDMEEIWKRYKDTKDPALREKLILKYSHLVKYIAGRLNIYFGSNVEYDDLIGYGVFGLIDAIEKFDIDKGVKFETYASLRIRGAIIDSIRELDWVPRSLRQKGKDVERVYMELENELGRSPSDEEAANRLGISMKEFNKVLNSVNLSSMMSLEEFLEQNYEIGVSLPEDSTRDRPEKQVELSELKDILADAINKLSEKEKTVISLYYFEELTLKEISAIMKVSESRVSQVHTKAIIKLKARISKHKEYICDN